MYFVIDKGCDFCFWYYIYLILALKLNILGGHLRLGLWKIVPHINKILKQKKPHIKFKPNSCCNVHFLTLLRLVFPSLMFKFYEQSFVSLCSWDVFKETFIVSSATCYIWMLSVVIMILYFSNKILYFLSVEDPSWETSI